MGLLQTSYLPNYSSIRPTFHKQKLENPFLKKMLFKFISPQNVYYNIIIYIHYTLFV